MDRRSQQFSGLDRDDPQLWILQCHPPLPPLPCFSHGRLDYDPLSRILRTCSPALRRYVRSIAFSPQGGPVISGSDDCTVQQWDMDTGACRQTFVGHDNQIIDGAYSPRGDQVASGHYGIVRLWNVEGVRKRRRDSEALGCRVRGRHTLIGHIGSAQVIAYSPQGGHVASGSMDGLVKLWDMGTEEFCCTLQAIPGLTLMSCSRLKATSSLLEAKT
ncbi:MAG: WD40-repeat-containing domain protein [Benniella sp.]|nr:MAG: WD40-repeat-containing domain protein [Benniella sp.]